MKTSLFPRISFVALIGLAAAALTLSGCGAGAPIVDEPATGPVSLPAFEGKVMGGETPIASTQVTLWETGNTGYGTGAAILAGPVTSSSPGGNFSFTTGYACANPSDFVYVTSTGGDVSNGATTAIINKNIVFVAMLGPCSSFATATAQSKVAIIVNELSTVAAAYALPSFMVVNAGTSGSTTYSSNQQVIIGSPANNNATTGSCTGTGTAMTCTAAGFPHAVNNAINLVNDSNLSGSGPTGLANASIPGVANSSVPQAVINSLGNILSYCTTGPGGTAGDGTTNCGNFFTQTTPPAGLAAPTDTLTAMMNIARAPYDNVGSGTCSGAAPTISGGLFCLITGTPPFQPSLAAAPHDWSVAIAYSGPALVTAPITAYSVTSGTATFTSANSFTAGELLDLSGFTTGVYLNGQVITVQSSGLSSSQFKATVTTPPVATVTAYSITSNVATFTAANTFAPGESVVLSGFPTSTFFNGQSVTVLSAGLSTTQFEANFTNANVTATTEAGTATIASSGTDSGTAGAPSYGSPQYLVLDANDNVYLQTANSYTGTAVGIAAMTNGGSPLWNTPWSTNICTPGMIAPDNIGNVWMTVNEPSSSTGCAFGIYEYSAASGAQENFFTSGSGTVCNSTTPDPGTCPGFTGYTPNTPIQSTPRPIQFDRFNNLWYARGASSGTQNVFELPYTNNTYANGTPTTFEDGIFSSNQLVVDSNSNVWIGNYSTSSGTADKIFLIPNTGTIAAPTYTATNGFSTTTLSTYDGGGVSLDAYGNIWTGSNVDVYSITPTGTSASPTTSYSNFALPASPTFTATIAASHPNSGEVDGGSNYWYPSTTASGSIYLQITPHATFYNAGTPANDIHSLRPCYVPAGGTTCDATLLIGSPTPTQYYQTGDPHVVQVDSSGDLWVAAGVSSTLTSGFIVEILGPGYPTWPLYNYGVFGKEPQ